MLYYVRLRVTQQLTPALACVSSMLQSITGGSLKIVFTTDFSGSGWGFGMGYAVTKRGKATAASCLPSSLTSPLRPHP